MKYFVGLIVALSFACKSESVVPNKELSWESGKPERSSWSSVLLKSVEEKLLVLDGAKDITSFCPKYKLLNDSQRVRAWSELMIGVSFYESSWNKTARYVETSFEYLDAVTGLQPVSEGLFQLSYQDIKWATWCEFDYEKDRRLAVTDPAKTIFQVDRNTTCAIGILSRQIAKYGNVVIRSGAYWAVLKTGNANNKADRIRERVKRFAPECI